MFLTLEPGGLTPPSDLEKLNLRTAFGLRNAYGDKDFASYVAADSPVALTTDGNVIFVNATAGDVILRLPAISATDMQAVMFKRTDSSLNTVTITPAVADVSVDVEGASSFVLPASAACEIRGDTANWWVTSLSLPNLISLL